MTGKMNAETAIESDVRVTQRRLLAKMMCIRSGLRGLASSAAADDKGSVDAIVQRVDAIVEAALTPPEDEENLQDFAKGIRNAVRDIESVVARMAPAQPPSDAPPAVSDTTRPGEIPVSTTPPTGG